MSTYRRLQNELKTIRTSGIKSFCSLQVNETDLFLWEGLLIPENPPYNKGAFRIQIRFPKNYPFRSPDIFFMTKIYHPNVGADGKVCLAIINDDVWKPSTNVHTVILSLIKLLNEPEPSHPLSLEIAQEYEKNRSKFLRNAEKYTRLYAEKRPKIN